MIKKKRLNNMWMYIIHRGTLGKERTVKEGMGKQWEN